MSTRSPLGSAFLAVLFAVATSACGASKPPSTAPAEQPSAPAVKTPDATPVTTPVSAPAETEKEGIDCVLRASVRVFFHDVAENKDKTASAFLIRDEHGNVYLVTARHVAEIVKLQGELTFGRAEDDPSPLCKSLSDLLPRPGKAGWVFHKTADVAAIRISPQAAAELTPYLLLSTTDFPSSSSRPLLSSTLQIGGFAFKPTSPCEFNPVITQHKRASAEYPTATGPVFPITPTLAGGRSGAPVVEMIGPRRRLWGLVSREIDNSVFAGIAPARLIEEVLKDAAANSP